MWCTITSNVWPEAEKENREREIYSISQLWEAALCGTVYHWQRLWLRGCNMDYNCSWNKHVWFGGAAIIGWYFNEDMMAQRSKPLQLKLLLKLILLIQAQSGFTLEHIEQKYFSCSWFFLTAVYTLQFFLVQLFTGVQPQGKQLVKWMPESCSYSYTLNFVLPTVDIRDHPAHSFFFFCSLFSLFLHFSTPPAIISHRL